MRVLAAFIIAASLGLTAAAHAEDSASRFGARSRDEFRASLSAHPYDPAGTRASKIIAGAQKVTRCMAHADVRSLMGEPNFGNSTHRSGDPSGKSAGAAWTYILSAVRGANDPYDHMITVWLDEHGRVKSVHPRGIDSVPPLRANDQQKCI